MQSPAQESLLKSLKLLQTSHRYSDLKICCEDQVFEVHKAIICPRSKFFAKACEWGQDGKLKEEIDMKDDDSRMISLMLDYFYQLDYDDLRPSQVVDEPSGEKATEPEVSPAQNSSLDGNLSPDEGPAQSTPWGPAPDLEGGFGTAQPEPPGWGFGARTVQKGKKKKRMMRPQRTTLVDEGSNVETARLTVNALMYALADKYEIEDLKAEAACKFANAAAQDWESQAFVHAAELVFSTTPSSDQGLRNVVVEVIVQHHELVNYVEIQNLLDSGNGIAWKVVQRFMGVQVNRD